MYRTKLTMIVAALSLMAGPTVAFAAGAGDDHPTGSGKSRNPTSACKGLSKKHVAGHPGTPFSRCVKAAAQLKKAQAADPPTTDRAKAADPAPAPAASPPADAVVCNEAQNSPRGTEDATASTDPLPPARHKSTAMPVGNGKGLTNAAANSPALAECGPQTPPDDGGNGTATGNS